MPTSYPGATASAGTATAPPAAPGGAQPGNVLSRFSTVVGAAQKWGIPPWVLWGVYGLETDFGKNVHTSTAGAVGDFQFLPSTAASYGYPLTNNPSQLDFERQANAAAHYLHDLGISNKASRAQIDKALLGYSANGYGVDKVETKAKSTTTSDIPIIGGVIDTVKGAADTVSGAAQDVGSAIGQFFTLITSLEFWLRVGEGIAGLVLIALGLKALTGISVPLPTGGRV